MASVSRAASSAAVMYGSSAACGSYRGALALCCNTVNNQAVSTFEKSHPIPRELIGAMYAEPPGPLADFHRTSWASASAKLAALLGERRVARHEGARAQPSEPSACS